jgi:hypothetical protein
VENVIMFFLMKKLKVVGTSAAAFPFPLVISNDSLDDGVPVYNNHCCAFAAWDKSIALVSCHFAAKGVSTLDSTYY